MARYEIIGGTPLRGCVTISGAKNAAVAGYLVGGKTGTAQNSNGCDNALFVCAAPIDNPEIVVSVVIEQGYSGSYAALTAGRVLAQYYK